MSKRELSVWDVAIKDAAIRRLQGITKTHQGDPERGRADALDVLGVLLTELGFADVVDEFNRTIWELEKASWQVTP